MTIIYMYIQKFLLKLGCPFVIAPSVFSNVVFYINLNCVFVKDVTDRMDLQ